MAQRTFQLTETQDTYIEEMIASGRYVDGSDLVRDLIRRDMDRSVSGDVDVPKDIDGDDAVAEIKGVVPVQEMARLERILQQTPLVILDKNGQSAVSIPATRLGNSDIQQQVLHDQAVPTVIQIHHFPALVFLPKALQVEVDPDAESIALSRLTTAPGGVLQSMGMSSKVHPLTKHGKVVGGLVAYEDAEKVLRGKGCDVWLVGGA